MFLDPGESNNDLSYYYRDEGYKGIGYQNRTYYFFDDMINIRSLDPNKIKIDENSYKTFSFITLVV